MEKGSGKQKNRLAAGIVVVTLAVMSFAACLSPNRAAEVDEAMVAWVQAVDTIDAGEMAEGIREMDRYRKESRRAASEAESRSIAESIYRAESIAEAESRSIEESIAESIAESIEESRSIEESIAESWAEAVATGNIPAGEIGPGKIVTVGDEAIPTIRRLFSDVVVFGNSRAKSILDSGILTEKTVLYQWAAHMNEITDMVRQAAGLQRKKALIIMGVNDLGYYIANVEKWRNDYIANIELFRSVNPTAEIYLQEIIPIHEQYRYRWYNMDRVVRYNEVLYELAAATGCKVISVTEFARFEYLSDDTGAHYNKTFHFYWAQKIANEMGLWEDYRE